MLLVEAAQTAVRLDEGLRQSINTVAMASPREWPSGRRTQVGGTTLLDAAHANAVSGDRLQREQPEMPHGRRKLGREPDWRSRIQRTGAKDALARLENQKTVFHFRTGDDGWMFA